MYYTGIGSRKTPLEILDLMDFIAYKLAKYGKILRSGGAEGADLAFEKGCTRADGRKAIFLPWREFNSNTSQLYRVSKETINFSLSFHPNPKALSAKGKLFHGRNAYQVLGENLNTPSDFIICYSSGKGGTEQALRIARYYNIPIFNLYYAEIRNQILDYFNQEEVNNVYS